MNKIGIIIKREYLSRVKKRSFILTTIGLPLVMLAFAGLMGYLAISTSEKIKIAVVDETKIFENKLWDSSQSKSFTYFNTNELDSLKTNYRSKNFDMLLHIAMLQNNKPDSNTVKIFSENNISSNANDYIENRINDVYQNKLMLDAGMNNKEIDSLKNISIKITNETEDKRTANANISAGIGQASGMLIYMIMFIYGMMVMRGVMEEKTNRIAEVIISSVKPFELMMGKVVGIALVGLTQFILWIVFIGIISSVAGVLMPHFFAGNTVALGSGAMPNMPSGNDAAQFSLLLKDVIAMPWLKIGICFVIYFMGGFFLYASLFAAVGSMVNEDMQESQSLMFPITMPIILGFFISMQAVRDPNSGIAVFGSLFPLTSPIVMMSRIAYNPPMWQIVLSIIILIATFIGTIWLASKIYRTGILMYGKKITWSEALKWIRK